MIKYEFAKIIKWIWWVWKKKSQG